VTEEQWQACADPVPMLAFLRERGSERKLRLVAVAACREIGDRITDGRSREAVAVAEMFAVPPTESRSLRDENLVQEIAPQSRTTALRFRASPPGHRLGLGCSVPLSPSARERLRRAFAC
jgi:hypothetical protein